LPRRPSSSDAFLMKKWRDPTSRYDVNVVSVAAANATIATHTQVRTSHIWMFIDVHRCS